MSYLKTLLLAGLLISIISCSSESTQKQESPSETAEESIDETSMSQFDRSVYDLIISELKGIEKHYVKNDLYRLLALLEYNQDERASDLKKQLEKVGDSDRSEAIMTLDRSNGYVVHNYGAQVDVEMTYWNLTNGDQLVAETFIYRSITPEDISFELYDSKGEMYKSLKVQEVIPQYEELEAMTVFMDPDKGADGGCIYQLPRNGVNLTFCADDLCVDLIWNDGVFELN